MEISQRGLLTFSELRIQATEKHHNHHTCILIFALSKTRDAKILLICAHLSRQHFVRRPTCVPQVDHCLLPAGVWSHHDNA